MEAQTLELRKMDPAAIYKAVVFDKVPFVLFVLMIFYEKFLSFHEAHGTWKYIGAKQAQIYNRLFRCPIEE